MSPEICIVVDIRIIRQLPEKADVFETSEGSSHVNANGELMRHHRGLRPGHVLKGVIRELGRTRCFLVKTPEIGINRLTKTSWRC